LSRKATAEPAKLGFYEPQLQCSVSPIRSAIKKTPEKVFFLSGKVGLEPTGSLSKNNRCSGCFCLQEHKNIIEQKGDSRTCEIRFL